MNRVLKQMDCGMEAVARSAARTTSGQPGPMLKNLSNADSPGKK